MTIRLSPTSNLTSTGLDDLESGGSGAVVEFSGSSIAITDANTFTVEEASPVTTKGLVNNITVTSTTAVGNVILRFYNDSSRSVLVYTMNIDLTDSTTYKSYESFGINCESTGILYGTVYETGVGGGETLDITLDVAALGLTSAPTPAPSPYGDGIEDDGLGKPRIALAASGGLEFSGGNLVIKPDGTKAATVSLGAGGAYVSGVVDTTTSQSVYANKVFDSVGCIPAGTSGAPVAGTYIAGSEILDSANIRYRCTVGGTPGTWELADAVQETPDDVFSSSLGDTDSEILEIPVTGNCGVIQQLIIFAYSASAADSYVPFRARIYETSDGRGRELLWQGNGQARQTALSAELPASQTYLEVDSNDYIDVDEALIVWEDSDRYELARCSARTSSNIDISESLVDASAWAVDTLILTATEWYNVPFVNKDGSDTNRIFLQIRHDGLATDPDLTFGVRAKVLNMGVLR